MPFSKLQLSSINHELVYTPEEIEQMLFNKALLLSEKLKASGVIAILKSIFSDLNLGYFYLLDWDTSLDIHFTKDLNINWNRVANKEAFKLVLLIKALEVNHIKIFPTFSERRIKYNYERFSKGDDDVTLAKSQKVTKLEILALRNMWELTTRKLWTKDEERYLLDLLHSNRYTIPEIAKILGRSLSAVQLKLRRLLKKSKLNYENTIEKKWVKNTVFNEEA